MKSYHNNHTLSAGPNWKTKRNKITESPFPSKVTSETEG